MNLLANVRHDLAANVTVVELSGMLDLTTVAGVRGTLAKCVAECPVAVIVDVRGLEIGSPVALTVFAAAARQHLALPAVAILLCTGPRTLVGPLARASVDAVPVFDSFPAAWAGAATTTSAGRRVRMALTADLAAPRAARDRVVAVCAEWHVTNVVNEARLIVSELVTNAVEHAGSDVWAEYQVRGPFLHLRVRDGSRAVPRVGPSLDAEPVHRPRGRGLRLVDLYSTAWGYVLAPDGKVVWATLRTQPVGG